MISATETGSVPPQTPPPELIARARALVREHPECFWFWRSGAEVISLDDAALVVKNLRENGGWRAWREAQNLHKCLSAPEDERE